MATTEDDSGTGRKPIPPAVRRRLQACFEQGSKVAAKGQFDYATDMFAQCLIGDPGNPIYVRSFLGNLSKKYNDNKSGGKFSGLKTAGAKAAIKKSRMQKDWLGAIKSGLDVLKHNPWETATLTDMAFACQQLEFDEAELEYLRMAVDADPTDVETNRVLGRTLERQGNFDEALKCFGRVIQAKPGDEEATRALADLAVKRTIEKGGYEEAQSTKEVRKDKMSELQEAAGRLTPEQQLQRAIKKDPADTNNYIKLSDIYLKDERYEEAETVLQRALEASGGGDINVRERLEDVQLRRARQHVQIAEEKARRERTQEAVALLNRMKVELNNKETEVYESRCQRYPANLGFKYELGVRLMRGEKYTEAIKLFQEARSDMQRKGKVLDHLGDCFSKIKQYRLALQHYEQAVAEMPARDDDELKFAMYKAGRLAAGLKQWEPAEKYFNELAARDFGYRDVAEWLDKIREMRENNGDPDAAE